MTPLCPHSLSIRPIVLDAKEQIRVTVLFPADDASIAVDGQDETTLRDGQHVLVEKSDKVTKLVVPRDYDFFKLLRDKL
jgi:NAD+ kinase